MARAWLIDSRGIARKVKSAAHFSGPQIKEWFGEANRECPNCNYKIDNSDVSLEWPGLPAGVKFDPSDVELLGHLAGKVGFGGSTAHAFIDEFIPTLENDEGICYTHPKDLPGIKMDGTSIHFFHRTTNAYATGSRKRRKIHRECNWDGGHVRWHKTGTTKVVIENGVPKGRKKIMVLYRNSTKGSKPDKTNWVMHQYHLGRNEEEKDGEFVVSKVFYQQQKQLEKCDYEPASQEPDASTVKTSPRTPKTTTPHPPRPRKPSTCEEVSETNLQVEEVEEPLQLADSGVPHLDDPNCEGTSAAWLAGESQAPEDIDESLFCDEILEPCHSLEPGVEGSHLPYLSEFGRFSSEALEREFAPCNGLSELENIELDTPPDIQLGDLQFGSQESVMGWLDRLFNDKP